MNFFEDLLKEGQISVYDLKGRHLPDLLSNKESGALRLFMRNSKERRFQSDGYLVQEYNRLSEVRDKYSDYTDIHLLDGEAIKLLLAKYPSKGLYTMVHVTPRFSWLLGFPGLMRRLVSKQVRLRGIVSLKTDGSTQRWLILEHLKHYSAGVSLSADIGIQGFLDHLRTEQVRYVVLRFYEQLPELHEGHGDLDILVADEDEEKMRRFLLDHPGKLHVDVCNVSSQYYPLSLADEILKNAVDGPGGSRIPGPREAFLSFAYHALYRRGFKSGIPSQSESSEASLESDSEYASILTQMAKNANIEVPINMESIDEYLHKEGWRAPREVLARRGVGNEWVQRRFLSQHQLTGVGIGLLILKEKAVRLGITDKILREIERQEFTILDSVVFDVNAKRIAQSTLRGGDWRSATGDTPFDSTPAMAVAVLDTRPRSMSRVQHGVSISRIRSLKLALRKKFDEDDSSAVHSADDVEAWEYVTVCFPESIETIRKKVNEHFLDFQETPLDRIRFSIERALTPRTLRQHLIRLLIN